MYGRKYGTVAVLLPTYNGARFIESQLRSLKENNTPFVLHWLDDHSTDNTREVVRTWTQILGIELVEWHQSQHLGWQVTFFQLLEYAEADIYLFCDQDDVWQSGKIDATVANLSPNLAAPALSFSHAFVFNDSEPKISRRVYDTLGVKLESALQVEKVFTFNPAQGNTMGFTRPLRDIFVSHKEIARRYAAAHDWWMYIIATVSGTSHLLSHAPTTLYRVHANNACGMYSGVYVGWKGITHVSQRWYFQHRYRNVISRQATGFCLAAVTLPQGSKLKRVREIAEMIVTLDRRRRPSELIRLARVGAMPPSRGWGMWLTAACLSCDATDRYNLPSERDIRC